jgi:hypothetical protein
MHRPAIAIVLAALVGGCSTPYQEMGFTGGVSAQPITADTYRISARGNGYTNSTDVQDYTLLKAAETTKAAGGTHFLVVSSANASSRSIGQTSGSVSTQIIGRTAYSTYTPGVTYEIAKPGEDAYIKIVNVSPGGTPPPGAFPADEIIAFIGPRVRRPKN